MSKYFCLLLILVLAALIAVGAPLSWAQQSDDKMGDIEKMFDDKLTQEKYFREDEMLVSATGSQLPIHKAPAVASIITAEDIEKMGATTLDEALAMVPGLYVSRTAPSYSQNLYSIRGIHTTNTPEVLLLINGVSITNLYGGYRPQNFILPVASISRIEVIRGPGSAVFGADAFSGTINVITKDSHELLGYTVGARAGSFNTYGGWAQYGGEWSRWQVAISLDYQQTKGDQDRIVESDSQTGFDNLPFAQSNASLAPGVMEAKHKVFDGHVELVREDWTIRLWSWLLDDTYNGTGVTRALGENETNVDQYLAELKYSNDHFAENWVIDASLSYLYNDSRMFSVAFPPGTTLLVGSDGNLFTPPFNVVTFTDGVRGWPSRVEKQSAIEAWAIYTGINNHRFRFGAGFKYLDLTAGHYANYGPGIIVGTQSPVSGDLTNVTGTEFAYIPDESRQLWYAFFQDEWSFARDWELTAGIRYDHYSDFGDTVNPRLAVVWETRYDLTTKLLYGRAFRAPSFQELYTRNNPSSIGNPGLDPESIDTLELAFDYQPLNNLHIIFNMFINEMKNLIEVTDESTFENARDQQGYGFELEVDWEATEEIRLYGNIAWHHAEDKDTGDPVPNAPQLQFYLNPHWEFWPDWSVDAQLYWIADQERPVDDPRDDLDDYALVNMTLRRKNIAKYWDIALRAQNLFDEDWRIPSAPSLADDYPMEGRSFYGEVRFHFE